MGLVIEAKWITVHNWGSEMWEKWTEQMMIDEIVEIDKFLKKNKMNVEFKVFIRKIELDGSIQVKDKLINFSKLQDVLQSWRHVTNTCEHYVREWIAQDESKLTCEFDKQCDGYNPDCEKYEPMLKARSVEKLLKKEKVVFS